MSTVVTLPQARIPLGWVTLAGADGVARRMPVEIDIEWMRSFLALVDRTGGTTGEAGFEDLLAMYFDIPPHDQLAQEAVKAVDELRNELASARSDMHRMLTIIEDQAAELASLRGVYDLRNRVETIEDRLQ